MIIIKPETNIDKILTDFRSRYYNDTAEDFEECEWDHLWDSEDLQRTYHNMVQFKDKGLLTLDRLEDILKENSPTHIMCSWCRQYTREPLLNIYNYGGARMHCLPCLKKGVSILELIDDTAKT